MSLIVELLALAEGLYVLIGAVIVLGGLALVAVELLQHLRDEEARTKRMSVANVYVNHVHIHVSSPPENGDGRDTQRGLPLSDGADGVAPSSRAGWSSVIDRSRADGAAT